MLFDLFFKISRQKPGSVEFNVCCVLSYTHTHKRTHINNVTHENVTGLFVCASIIDNRPPILMRLDRRISSTTVQNYNSKERSSSQTFYYLLKLIRNYLFLLYRVFNYWRQNLLLKTGTPETNKQMTIIYTCIWQDEGGAFSSPVLFQPPSLLFLVTWVALF